jgi:plasmid stabilization system protein ParE
MKVRILACAFQDLEDGRDFYDQQDYGVGDYFIDCLTSDIDSLARYGGIHGVRHGFHRMISRRFPYAIYYRVLDNEAVVFRVLDCRRSPLRIRQILDGETP